jgi:hypothetical protein
MAIKIVFLEENKKMYEVPCTMYQEPRIKRLVLYEAPSIRRGGQAGF